MSSDPKAVVLLSGGLDSATALAEARAAGFDCYALTLVYGIHGWFGSWFVARGVQIIFAPTGMILASIANALARCLLDLERSREALAILDEAIALQPQDPETLANRGRALQELGRLADAEHSFIVTFPESSARNEGPVPNLPGAGGAAQGGPIDVQGSAIRPTLVMLLDGKKLKEFEIGGPQPGEAVSIGVWVTMMALSSISVMTVGMPEPQSPCTSPFSCARNTSCVPL